MAVTLTLTFYNLKQIVGGAKRHGTKLPEGLWLDKTKQKKPWLLSFILCLLLLFDVCAATQVRP